MKRLFFGTLLCIGVVAWSAGDAHARGGGRGGFGGGGGGGARMGGGMGGGMGGQRMGGGGFSPSAGRGSLDGGMARGGMDAGRGFDGRSGNFGGGSFGADRAGAGNFGGDRVGGAGNIARDGGFGNRPSAGQLNDFLNVPHPAEGGLGNRVGAGGVTGGGAAADFLKGRGVEGAVADRPAAGNVFGDRPGLENRPAVADRPGLENRPAIANRPGLENRPAFENRPDRIQNRQEWMDNRTQRWGEVRNQVLDNYPRLNFWSNYPGWAAWRINAPYRWAAWGALSGWLGYGANMAAMPYNYGDTIYYQDNSVYTSDGSMIASADDYAQQAATIASSAPDTPPEQSDWLPLGVFAITQDGQSSGTPPTRFMQLAVSKQGVLNGLLTNKLTDETQQLEGAIDKASQRAAWTVQGQSRPIIETGLQNLTSDSGPALIHFEDGKTQQVLLVRLPDPDNATQTKP